MNFPLKKELGDFCKNVNEAIKGTDAVVVLTEWEEYTRINWDEAAKMMRSPAWVLTQDPLQIKMT